MNLAGLSGYRGDLLHYRVFSTSNRLFTSQGFLLFTLVLGLALFIGAHMLREIGIRTDLKNRLGKPAYSITMIALILSAISLLVVGKSSAPFIQVWSPPFHWRVYTDLLMFSACVFFILGFLPTSHSKKHLHHPALIGVTIWGGAHLLANGDLASIFLFGGLAAWALIKIVSLAFAKQTAQIGAEPAPAFQWDFAALILGFITYSTFLMFHGQLFGFALIDTM